MNDAPIITDEDVEEFLKSINYRRPSAACPVCTPQNRHHLGVLCWIHQQEADEERSAYYREFGHYPDES